MRLTVCFIGVCVLFFHTGSAQLNHTETNNGGTLQLADQNGRSLVHTNYDSDIQGSPYLNPDFLPADLVTANGHVFEGVKVKFNLERNEIYFIDPSGQTLVAQAGVVRKLIFTQLHTKEGAPVVFQSGYPPADKQRSTYYYQVLEAGTVELLRAYRKTIEAFKNDMSGERRKEFVEQNALYVFAGGKMQSLRYDKTFVLSLLANKQPEVEKYLSANRLNFKKAEDVQKLVRYYNSLLNEK